MARLKKKKSNARRPFVYEQPKENFTKEHANQLLAACIQAIITGKIYVIMGTSYKTKFPKNFPWGKVFKRDRPHLYRMIHYRVLMKWLYDNGYTTITGEAIAAEHRRLTYFERRIEMNLLSGLVDD